MYTALYRSERPEVFAEVLGQEHIVKILQNQIATDTVSHAYLFCGTRGTGKTTMARILAKAVNCTDQGENKPCGKCSNCLSIKDGNFIDVIEIDAASNNGVENIREINESVKYPPSVGKKKVYIIDEVHMLSTGAFNALLKTLEEPPENVIFILATTEPQKLPATVLSRCMKLDFRRVPEETISRGMKKICQDRNVEITEDGLKLLVANADGSVRDGLSILEQCLATGEKRIDRDLILEFLGTVGDEFFVELTDKVLLGKLQEALVLLNQVLKEGKDIKQLIKDWTAHYRNLLVSKFVSKPEEILNMSSENIQRLKEQSIQIPTEEINQAIVILSKTVNEARWSTQPRILLEMALVQIASGNLSQQEGLRVETNSTLKEKVAVPEEKTVASEEKVSASEENAGAPEEKNLAPEENAGAPEEKNLAPEEKGLGPKEPIPEPRESNDLDLDMIWQEVLQRACSKEPGLNVIRSATRLLRQEGSKFTIGSSNLVSKNVLESNQKFLEEILSEISGLDVKIICEITDFSGKIEEPEEDLQDIVASKLGIDPEVK